MSQSALLKQRRFAPFFCTQFLGAYTDNIFKNTLMLILAFKAPDVMGLNTDLLMNIAAFLFILPFFLFSSIAGQITDKYEKSALIRRIKFLEIIIMACAAVGLMFEQYAVLLLLLFLMGTQSSFFGPAKYAILPQHLEPKELLGGNALVEMGTFVSILLGTIGAGILMQFDNYLFLTAMSVVIFSTLGYLTSRGIPEAKANHPDLKISYDPFSTSLAQIRKAKETPGIYISIIAISWFWFVGAAYLTQFPNFSKSILNGDSSLVTLLLVLFTLGIGFGSMLCEKLSRSEIKLSIVPIGAAGLTAFGIDLYFAIPEKPVEMISWIGFVNEIANWRVLIDLLGIGIFGGIFIVPLYAYVQQRSDPAHRARMIAVINIMNAFFMVMSALAGMIILGIMKLSITDFFLMLAVGNLLVSLYIFSKEREFVDAWILKFRKFSSKSNN